MSQALDAGESNLETPNSQIEQEITISEFGVDFRYGIMEQSNSNMVNVSKNFFKNTKNSTDILPPVTRWISRDMSTIAVERPPLNCTIKYQDVQGELEDEDFEHWDSCDPDYGCECERPYPETFSFNINIPWTVWFFSGFEKDHLPSVKVFCRPSPLNSFSDQLYALPVTNIYPDASICWGSFHPINDPEKYNNFSAFVLDAINGFWTDTFNNDLTTMITEYFPKEMGCHIYSNEFFASWAKLSMEEVLGLSYRALDVHQFGDCTFGDLVNYFDKNTALLDRTKDAGHVELSKFFWDLLK
jgi:hypothetical protein